MLQGSVSRHRLRQTLLALLILAIASLIWLKNSFNSTPSLTELLKKRENFIAQYSERGALLRAYELSKATFILENPTRESVAFKPEFLFFSKKRIDRELGIEPNLTEAEKAEKIFQFIQQNSRHAVPLYLNNSLHHGPHFFSVYGNGFCDDAALNTVSLAKTYGLKARSKWLDMEHVIAEVWHDGKWRVYDADNWGIIRNSANEVADYQYLEQLSDKNKLPSFNEVVSKRQNIEIFENSDLLTEDRKDPSMSFLPGERRIFFDKAYMLSTDGSYLEKHFSNPEDFLSHYKGLGNFVREIPITSELLSAETLVVEDYFPISGAFLMLSKNPESVAVEILAESELAGEKKWLSPKAFSSKDLRHHYLDLSIAINNFERLASFRLKIRGLKKLLQTQTNMRLLTVHMYSSKNVSLKSKAKDELSSTKLYLRTSL